MLQGVAIAKRLQMSAENAADSYARSIKKAVEQIKAEKPKKAAGKAKSGATAHSCGSTLNGCL